MASNNDSNDINILNSIVMNDDRFLSLLDKLIGESIHLQNNPAQGILSLSLSLSSLSSLSLSSLLSLSLL